MCVCLCVEGSDGANLSAWMHWCSLLAFPGQRTPCVFATGLCCDEIACCLSITCSDRQILETRECGISWIFVSIFFSMFCSMGCDRISTQIATRILHLGSHSKNGPRPWSGWYSSETYAAWKNTLVRFWNYLLLVRRICMKNCYKSSESVPYFVMFCVWKWWCICMKNRSKSSESVPYSVIFRFWKMMMVMKTLWDSDSFESERE